MNIIFNDSNINIGGIEVMFIEMTEYLISQGHKVFFLVENLSIYEKKLSSHEHVYFIRRKTDQVIEFMSDKKIEKEREFVLKQFNLSENYYVISPYFDKLQLAMALFKSHKNFKLLNLWPHPEEWTSRVRLIGRANFSRKIYKNKKYKYQRKLLELLDLKNGHFYGGRVVPIFNNWFYKINLNPPTIEALPIKDIEFDIKLSDQRAELKSIKIIWCGRFDYFKNEAIISISNVLNNLVLKFPEYKVVYGIIGYGSDKYTREVQERINSQNIEVEFIGKVEPENLTKVFRSYDIGIGMGLSVKKMAQVGIPSIVIDSVGPKDDHPKNSNWLFDTKEGDAGDGYYYRIANNSIENRESLHDLLERVFSNPSLLKGYGDLSFNYVNEFYSFEKQVNAIIHGAKTSNFFAEDYPVFKRKKYEYLIYQSFQSLARLKNKIL